MSGGVLYKVWKRPIIDGDLVEARMVFSYDGVTDVGIKRFSLEEVNSNMIPVSAAVKLMADHFSKGVGVQYQEIGVTQVFDVYTFPKKLRIKRFSDSDTLFDASRPPVGAFLQVRRFDVRTRISPDEIRDLKMKKLSQERLGFSKSDDTSLRFGESVPVPDFTRAIEPLVTFDKWNHKKILLDIEPKSQDKIPPEGNPTLGE